MHSECSLYPPGCDSGHGKRAFLQLSSGNYLDTLPYSSHSTAAGAAAVNAETAKEIDSARGYKTRSSQAGGAQQAAA